MRKFPGLHGKKLKQARKAIKLKHTEHKQLLRQERLENRLLRAQLKEKNKEAALIRKEHKLELKAESKVVMPAQVSIKNGIKWTIAPSKHSMSKHSKSKHG